VPAVPTVAVPPAALKPDTAPSGDLPVPPGASEQVPLPVTTSGAQLLVPVSSASVPSAVAVAPSVVAASAVVTVATPGGLSPTSTSSDMPAEQSRLSGAVTAGSAAPPAVPADLRRLGDLISPATVEALARSATQFYFATKEGSLLRFRARRKGVD
jgi:hypothetical protein